VARHFHNKYIISTTQNVLKPMVSGGLWTTITSTEERAIFQQERVAYGLQENRQRGLRMASGRLLQRVVPEE
jgi:hypothetical protein